MIGTRIWRWMVRLTMGGLLAVNGCPNMDDVQNLAAGSVESFLNGLVSIVIEEFVNTAFNQ